MPIQFFTDADRKRLDEFPSDIQLLLIMGYLGYRKMSNKDMDSLSFWLVERALEHDKPYLLYEMACEKLLKERIVRPIRNGFGQRENVNVMVTSICNIKFS